MGQNSRLFSDVLSLRIQRKCLKLIERYVELNGKLKAFPYIDCFHKLSDYYFLRVKRTVVVKLRPKRDAFSDDETRDVYLCPNGRQLKLNPFHRSASGLYWLYLADRRECQSCPLRQECLSEGDKRGARKLEYSYFWPARQRHLARRWEPEYREAPKKRQIWCEGTFAAQKWDHNLTRVLRRGLEVAEDHCLLSATALNRKRMIRSMN